MKTSELIKKLKQFGEVDDFMNFVEVRKRMTHDLRWLRLKMWRANEIH